MYGKKARTIRRLRAQVDAILEQRDQAIAERNDAVRLNSRLANKVTAATTHADRAAKAWTLVVRDANTAEALFTRASELLRRREARHRTAVADLKRNLAAARREAAAEKTRADALAERVHTLTTANQAGDWAKPVVVPAAA